MRRAVAVDKIDKTLQLMHSRNYIPIASPFDAETISHLDEEYTFNDFKKDVHCLDAGCGTGNYIKALYELGVGNIQGMDISEGMISKCLEKFKDINTNILDSQSIKLHPGFNLNETFPFKSESFDMVLMTQVLHHVVDTNGGPKEKELQSIEKVIENAHDILQSEGALFITTSTPSQLEHGSWFAQFFPRAVDEMIAKHADLEWWENVLRNHGFDDVRTHRIIESHVITSDYLDIEGIFDAEWRKCDSLFGLITDGELKDAQCQVKEIINDEEKKVEFLRECENSRKEVGNSVALIAFKQ